MFINIFNMQTSIETKLSYGEEGEVGEEIDEKHIWEIIRSHFNTKGLISHQIDSFNDYINFGIQRVIDEESDIVFFLQTGIKPNGDFA